MEVSDLDHAISLADSGARVLFLVDYQSDVADVMRAAQGTENAIPLTCAYGRERICMESSGEVVIRSLHAGRSVRGYTFDAVFAPTSVWESTEYRERLALSTARSTFFEPGQPRWFATV